MRSVDGNVTVAGSTIGNGIGTYGDAGNRGNINVQNSFLTAGIGRMNSVSNSHISLTNTTVNGRIHAYAGNISLSGTTVTGSSGAGISIFSSYYSDHPSQVTLLNSTISGHGGSGIIIGAGSVRLINSTVSGNSAIDINAFPYFFGDGGGIRAPRLRSSTRPSAGIRPRAMVAGFGLAA